MDFNPCLSLSLSSAAKNDNQTAQELKVLQSELSRAQTSNLLESQRSFSLKNSSKFGEDALDIKRKQSATKDEDDRVSNEVAERQVQQLQKAQAVAKVHIQPLHVNLPTRGLRHSFSQVLQTDVQKPLTIEFHASNSRKHSVVGLLAGVVFSFVAVWSGTAFVVSHRKCE